MPHALTIDHAFCAYYNRNSNVTVRGLRWFSKEGKDDQCKALGRARAVFVKAGADVGWRKESLIDREMGCGR